MKGRIESRKDKEEEKRLEANASTFIGWLFIQL